MRRGREQVRKLLCVGVDLPIDAGTCGRFVHAGYQRCIALHEAQLVGAQVRVSTTAVVSVAVDARRARG